MNGKMVGQCFTEIIYRNNSLISVERGCNIKTHGIIHSCKNLAGDRKHCQYYCEEQKCNGKKIGSRYGRPIKNRLSGVSSNHRDNPYGSNGARHFFIFGLSFSLMLL